MADKNALDVLRERGFIAQTVYEDDLYKMLDNEKVTFYVGFDPTADSLHIGHYIPIMAMAHMQKAGHRPIALMGGGTGMIGDPSGKSELRKMLTREEIDHNVERIKAQMSRFLDFSDGKAIIANNADWLLNLNYVDFLREVGVHFSVNRMLTAECYKQRMEKGLTFLEFNYMLMQGYDFLELFRRYGCRVELGGDDQWSNILAGADLIRRKERQDAFAVTFKLLLTHDGRKMGKTEAGALWLDPKKTSPYDFYQYWRNVDDQDVEKCLALLTFLPMDEVRRLGALQGSEINEAKKVLAYEVTKLVHGEAEAEAAARAAGALFGGNALDGAVPTTEIESLEGNKRVIDLMVKAGLCKSLGEGRRLIAGGGVYLNDKKVENPDQEVTEDDFGANGLMLRKGKKAHHRILMK
ncbi:MAG: tyrosine--tRNA ligase [Candidatus Spyradocola sp.]|nr:tyrosine--tRNA ligase [Candidatus Spyradocola sp.]